MKIDFSLYKRTRSFSLNATGAFEDSPIGLLGPRRSGKTMLLELIAGYIKPTSGHLRLNDEELYSSERRVNVPMKKRKAILISSDPLLFPHMSVKKNILYGLKTPPEKTHSSQIIDLLNLYNSIDRKVGNLDFWERERVALARAIIRRPDIILVDEPIASAPLARQDFVELLRRINRYLKVPLIYASHSPSEMIYLTEHLIIIKNGLISTSGSTSEVLLDKNFWSEHNFEAFQNIYELNLLEYNEEQACLSLDFFGTPIAAACQYSDIRPRYKVSIRADAIEILPTKRTSINGEQLIPAKVELIIPCDKHAIVYLTSGGEGCFVKSSASPQIKENDQVFLACQKGSIVVL